MGILDGHNIDLFLRNGIGSARMPRVAAKNSSRSQVKAVAYTKPGNRLVRKFRARGVKPAGWGQDKESHPLVQPDRE
jgi:hypothetical protein